MKYLDNREKGCPIIPVEPFAGVSSAKSQSPFKSTQGFFVKQKRSGRAGEQGEEGGGEEAERGDHERFLDPVKTLSNGGWKSNGVPAPPCAEPYSFAGLRQARIRKLGYNTCGRLFRPRTHRVFDPKLSP
jgi:hypothetical protein